MEDERTGEHVSCKKCGGTKWVEFELRKLGLVIPGGVPCISAHCVIQPVKFLRCHGCGERLTSDEARTMIGESSSKKESIRAN